MKYKYSIIESDRLSVINLQDCLKNFPDYTCIGASGCYDESLDIILNHTPDVIFINVDGDRNDDQNPFNFINELYNYHQDLPFIIGLSNSKDQAYNCIKSNFFDYLLKPLNCFEIRKSISRLSKMPVEKSNKLCLKSYKDYRFVNMDEILFLKADNTSTDFFMHDDSKVSAYKTLKYFESILPENFTRIHNSYIVNENYVSRINFGKSKCTIKKTSYYIPFSRSYRDKVAILEKSLSKKSLLSLN